MFASMSGSTKQPEVKPRASNLQAFRQPHLHFAYMYNGHITKRVYGHLLWLQILQQWMQQTSNHTLLAVPLPTGTLAAPKQVLNLLCCNCSSSEACCMRRCSCLKANLACNVFCKCHTRSDVLCRNPLNKTITKQYQLMMLQKMKMSLTKMMMIIFSLRTIRY